MNAIGDFLVLNGRISYLVALDRQNRPIVQENVPKIETRGARRGTANVDVEESNLGSIAGVAIALQPTVKIRTNAEIH
jgi:hypothetical protein